MRNTIIALVLLILAGCDSGAIDVSEDAACYSRLQGECAGLTYCADAAGSCWYEWGDDIYECADGCDCEGAKDAALAVCEGG